MATNYRVRMDEKTNLLGLEEHIYHLVDVKEPNVFRNLFPYEEVPKIAFNDRIVPHNMPKEIWITDTTFRDGQQSRTPYTTEQIVTMYDYLHKLGGPKGIIRQSEFFLYSKKDRDAVYKCMERGYQFPEVTSWIRATQKDFELVKDIGLKETGILVSCSDYHIFYKLKMSRKECMDHYLDIVRQCLDQLSFRGYHPFRYLRLRDSLLSGTDEITGGVSDTGKDPRLRHDGLWRQFFRRCDPQIGTGDYLRPDHTCGRAFRTIGVART